MKKIEDLILELYSSLKNIKLSYNNKLNKIAKDKLDLIEKNRCKTFYEIENEKFKSLWNENNILKEKLKSCIVQSKCIRIKNLNVKKNYKLKTSQTKNDKMYKDLFEENNQLTFNKIENKRKIKRLKINYLD